MTNESVFEKDYIIKFFVEKLGYQSVSNNLFHDGNMLYREGLKNFLEVTQSDVIRKIIKDEYNNNENIFWEDLFSFVSQQVYYKHNVCIKMNKCIFFKGKYPINLYESFDEFSENRNDYAIMSQLPVNRKRNPDYTNIIPDIGIFINGILVSYMELKFNNTRQNARDNGRKKIISDYSECVGEHVYPYYDKKSVGEKNELVYQKLKLFHSPIFLIALDNHEAYVYRNIRDLLPLAISDYKSGSGLSKKTMSKALKDFLIDCNFQKNNPLYPTNADKMHKFLHETFCKESMQNEIKILNGLAYSKASNRRIKDKTAKMFNPRPNQKYAIDAMTSKTKEYYNDENDYSSFEEKERKRLRMEGAPDIVIEEAIEAHKKYKNNKDVYSLLLQYSTGFGKTYVACTGAISLKNMKDKYGNFLFNKIFLISDRVDLREQVLSEMNSMNIDKSLFVEPRNKKELKEALSSNNKRIIIVNIQKFPFLKELLEDKDKELMKDKRFAFIIDEVHRSNSGIMHETMMTIFDEVGDLAEKKADSKKNLIIALTATPTEENLCRFGELNYINGRAVWLPFDSYTMKSAIEDGFVLNPIQAILYYSCKFYFEEKEGVYLPTSKTIYSNENRINECVKVIVKTLMEVTYNKISKQGKAMLCCYSIEVANMYHDKIIKEIEKIGKEKNYSKTEIEDLKRGILMVYTPSQETGLPAYKRCGLKSEDEVIRKFRDIKNGLMIVVDKLQTGFNEPKLHTIFLDKEVKDINCIQTLSRVNRVMTGKDDCLVVDFSYNNVNKENIKAAFSKFEGIVPSTMNPFSIVDQINESYKYMINSEYYKLYFRDTKRNIDRALQKSDYIKKSLEDKGERVNLNILYKNISGLRKGIETVKNIIVLDDIYLDENLMFFIKEFMNLVYIYTSSEKATGDNLVDDDIIIDDSGFIIDEESSTFNPHKVEEKGGSIGFKSTGISSLDEIIRLNKHEDEKILKIDEFKKSSATVFDIMNSTDNEKNSGLFHKTLKYENRISDEDYEKIYRLGKRQIKLNHPSLMNFINYIENVKDFFKIDYIKYLKEK